MRIPVFLYFLWKIEIFANFAWGHSSEFLSYDIDSRCKTHLLDRNFSKIQFLLPPEISTIFFSSVSAFTGEKNHVHPTDSALFFEFLSPPPVTQGFARRFFIFNRIFWSKGERFWYESLCVWKLRPSAFTSSRIRIHTMHPLSSKVRQLVTITL